MAIERERREAERLRAETAADREAVRQKLEALQARRDKLHDTLRGELESAFRGAHEQVAAIIRDLQRSGGGRAAAAAREKLLALQKTAAHDASLAPRPKPHRAPDWRRARAGDRVTIAGGQVATLEALPDRRGRVAVRVGSARLVLPADQVAAAEPDTAPERVREGGGVSRPPDPPPAPHEIDLRGERAEAARERLAVALDQSLLAGRSKLRVIHGVGSGALRRALRDWLRTSPYVESFDSAPADAGGEGVTEIALKG